MSFRFVFDIRMKKKYIYIYACWNNSNQLETRLDRSWIELDELVIQIDKQANYIHLHGSEWKREENIFQYNYTVVEQTIPCPPCCACINYQSANKISRKEIIGRGYYNHPRDSILSSLSLRLSFDSWQVDKRGWYPYTDYTSILNLGSPRIAINLRGTAERSKRWCAILISQRLKY